MDEHQRRMCAEVHKLTSGDALRWVLYKYLPTTGDNVGAALGMIGCRPWAKREQGQLYDAYFWRAFPSSQRPLEVFTKFMSPISLLHRIGKAIGHLPQNESRTVELARYRLAWFRERLPLQSEQAVLQLLLAELSIRFEDGDLPITTKASPES